MKQNIKIAKELIKLAKNIVATNLFEKLQQIKQKIIDLDEQLNSYHKEYDEKVLVMNEIYNYLNNNSDSSPLSKKYIRIFQQYKDHLIRRIELEKLLKDNQELLKKYEPYYYNDLKSYTKLIQSTKRKLQEYKLWQQDIEHKIGGKMELLTSKLPDEFEQAMQELRKICISLVQRNIEYNINNLNIQKTDEKIWYMVLHDGYYGRFPYIPYFEEEKEKVQACKTYQEFLDKINNGYIKINTNSGEERFKKYILEEIEKLVTKRKNGLNDKISKEKNRNSTNEGNIWYKQQRIKLLGQLAEYCDDIISAQNLRMADNGQFNVDVISSNGNFRVLTSYVVGHYRQQGYVGDVWVRPHWRLTVRRINK